MIYYRCQRQRGGINERKREKTKKIYKKGFANRLGIYRNTDTNTRTIMDYIYNNILHRKIKLKKFKKILDKI